MVIWWKQGGLRGLAAKSMVLGILLLGLPGLAPNAFCVPGQQPAERPQAPANKDSANNFDGPAELPRVWMKSALSDTPATGQTRVVNAEDDLQQAINNAQCGDTLRLQAGATFRGSFRFAAKACDDAHWIIVRSGAPDDALPPEGTRITPCYAGVPALPGRPDLHCAAVRNVLAKLEFEDKAGSGPLAFMPGANHYRFIGLEVTRGLPGASITALGFMKEKGTADHLVFDRVWMHGTAQDETTRGLALKSMTYVAVVDSFFSDFHCIAATGACTDSQALVGGGGDDPQGPFKIVNNFLEASGENILFGGGAATITPTDIEIRHNYLFKPMIWKQGTAGFVGGASGRPFIVKNHFELKNAQRVLFEGNVLENAWGGFSQTGFSILLTPKNQGNNCPKCRVTDITLRYNKVRSVGSVLQIANVKSDAGGSTAAGERYSIHDLIAEDVQEQQYGGFGLFAIILADDPPLRDVRIEHVTAFVPRGLFSIANATGQKLANFVIANNLFSSSGPRQIGSAGGGPRNCAFKPDAQGPAGIFKSCFADPVVTHNLIVGGSDWPTGNIMAKDAAGAGLRILPGNVAQDYRLCQAKHAVSSCKKTSPAIGAASDGRDIGADVERIEQLTAGVN
jgi:hypothetical protein